MHPFNGFARYAGQRYTNCRFDHTPRAGYTVTQLRFAVQVTS